MVEWSENGWEGGTSKAGCFRRLGLNHLTKYIFLYCRDFLGQDQPGKIGDSESNEDHSVDGPGIDRARPLVVMGMKRLNGFKR